MGSELLQLKDIDKKLIFKITWKVFLNDHYMQMLLHFDEDLDDDFIQDILALLWSDCLKYSKYDYNYYAS